MPQSVPVSVETVRGLAAAAQLRLSPERARRLAGQLEAWLTAASQLNVKMSAPEHWELAPVTRFTHLTVEGGGE